MVELRVSFLLFISFRVKSEIYLHNTNDGFDIESYDCVLGKASLVYCRRPREPTDLTRDNDTKECTQNGGRVHRFSELRSKNISTSTIVHQWRSSLERVEDYARYWRDSSQPDGSLCECFLPGSFGKSCEYRLPIGETVEETLEWQLIMRQENLGNVQIYGDVICYETLQCDSGVLCLDWREVCDGLQHCLEGKDEENCDLLEMNQCDEEEEYRCMNGMCIPDQFFLDGEFDCLDWSDEMPFKSSEKCSLETTREECDDHLCPPNQWSCGDGQCIDDRLDFQDTASGTCQSGRDQYFICETHAEKKQWTMSNGRCVDVDESDGRYEESSVMNRSADEQCEYLLRCSLSEGGEKDCPCSDGPGCVEKLSKVCQSLRIRYPRQAIVAPFLFILFNYTKNWLNNQPDSALINGTVRCGDSLVTVIDRIIPFGANFNVRRLIQDHFCQPAETSSWSELVQPRGECHRANESTNRCEEWNPCMSITRIRDGWKDCLNGRDEDDQTSLEIEKSCARIREHRFRCSVEQPACLSVMRIGDSYEDCRNEFDEWWLGIGRVLYEMNCNDRRQDECSLLRQYVDRSWASVSLNNSEISSERRIPFRSYCDSFWDLQSGEDENLRECQHAWICAEDQQPCQTGLCIEHRWFSDHQWDCADASDEYKQLISNTHSALQEASQHDFTNRSYFIPSSCLQSHPFLCLSAEATQQGFSCFNLSQIGDGHIDCAGAIDEQNTLKHCSQSSMLGLNFLCPSTNTCVPYRLHCFSDHRCPNPSDDEHWCDRQRRAKNCSGRGDFTCLNGECDTDGRCDGVAYCRFGEDEYMCHYFGSIRRIYVSSREEKHSSLRIKQHIVRLSQHPREANVTQLDSNSISIVQPTSNVTWNLSSSSLSPYWCNRGLGVLTKNDSLTCFCPPQYYGEKCQYHADRLSVLLHLNLSQCIYFSTSDSRILLKLVVLLLFNDEVLTRDQFHLHPALESRTLKVITHFVYSHSFSSRQQRRERFFNRSSLLASHPYSIRMELYRTRHEEQPSLIAVWKYPVDFDHLPVSRLAKILHFPESLSQRNPCSSQPCHRNEQCQQLMNNHSQYICLCKTNLSGENCSIEDPQCAKGYCSSGSLCQANSRRSVRADSMPFCVCPLNRYGDRCEIEHDRCLSSSCLHGGSCLPDVQPNRVICLCTKEYSGPLCQWRRPSIHLSFSVTLPHQGAVIQYLQIDLISLHLILVNQQAFHTLPQKLEYYHSDPQTSIPDIVLAKLYSSDEDLFPDLHLLSVHSNLFSFAARTEISPINRCSDIRTFSNGNSSLLSRLFPSIALVSFCSVGSSPIRYHQMCIADRTRLCFRDDVYLCICGENHSRVECFNYNDQFDRCSHCLAGGRCLQGDRRRSSDFVCLCPPCHSGEQCQFSSESLVFTLDQLFSPDLFSSHKETTMTLLTLFSLCLFFLALPNNLFSFVTLRRRPCLRYGIGHYLLWMSVINQVNLLFFVARLSHLMLKISNTSSSAIWDDLLCKSLNYFLSSLTRLVYWLTSLVSIERLYMTLIINGQWLKKPRVARRLILLTFVVVFSTDLYELFFYKSLSNAATGQGSICVLDISKNDRTLWMTFHLLFLLLNSLLPFLINLFSTLIITLIIVKKKMKTNTSHSSSSLAEQIDRSHWMNNSRRRLHFIVDVLRENKEFVIGPAITLVPQLFSLPLFISSFIFNCQNLEDSWLRHFLIVSFWFSFTPQWTSFFLYISPSSFYSSEWHKTTLGRWIDTLLRRHPSTKSNFTAASGTKSRY